MAARPVTPSSGAATPDAFTKLHWESEGAGAAVVLITGLGLSGGSWWRTVPVLAKRLRVITFDNRGTGRSSALKYAYTTEAIADDVVAVLDSAGVERAHVYGISLGGMVAQQLALRYPERVGALVLGATHPGGRRAVVAEDEVLSFFRRRAKLPSEESAWASVPYNYGPRCRREHAGRIAEDIERRLAHPFDGYAYRAQMCAAALHNCFGRLPRIRGRTMVVHGRGDRMVPVRNAEILAERIPGARLHVIDDCGHLYTTEAPEADRAIADFLAEAPA
jgi:3-oxoadipate enol-lactonase